MPDRYAVVGNPVAHSKSPQIHAAFAHSTGADMSYERLLAPLDGFVAAVEAFRREGGRGLNVTVPFKVERVGNLNYPEAARERKLYGSLLLTVSIRADGSVETVEVNRSSGHRILDAAAVRIVEMAAPYAAFPPDVRRDTDILHITRMWTFTKGDELVAQ